jgi:predicted nucleic acid-binding Zn ribbon protein
VAVANSAKAILQAARPAMTTYVYETIPDCPNEAPIRFEVQQSMHDAPLTKHPKTGEPVRRVIAGGFGFIAHKSNPPPRPCGGHCACHSSN